MNDKPRATRILSEKLDNGMQLVVVRGEKFGPGTAVVLDGHIFEDCEFDDCVMCYFGGPVRIRGKINIQNPEWRIQAAAIPAMEMFANLCRLSPQIRADWLKF